MRRYRAFLCRKQVSWKERWVISMSSWVDYWNGRVQRFTIVDVKLLQVGSMAGALVIVKWFPQIMNVSIWWFAVLCIICMLRPVYVFWIEDDDTDQRTRKSAKAIETAEDIAQIKADIDDIKEQIADFIIKQV
jgi:hypothetical protein